MKDPYAAACAHKMWNLRSQYPASFWAAPEEFFTDGALVNRGSDFGLMPSAFEPGGIVQHEFFVGATPVVAFKTGGLKDSVLEFQWESEEGTGFTFETYTAEDMVFSMERAIGTFKNKEKYAKLRDNAFEGTMSGDVVCKAWLGEFYRLRGKIYVDETTIAENSKDMTQWTPDQYKPINIVQELFGIDNQSPIMNQLQDIDHGAASNEDNGPSDRRRGSLHIDDLMSAFDRTAFNLKPYSFRMHNIGPQHEKVQICGSFDGPDWQVRHDMNFDSFTNQWYITLHLQPGQEYYYKYVINDQHWVVNEDETKAADAGMAGNVNNVCRA